MAIKKIKDIYTDYFQKSKVFLYPALGHKRGSGVTPIETYMSWDGVVDISSRKLVCLYHIREDEEFIRFEEEHLYGHPLFDEYKEVDYAKAVYTFDFSKHAEDFDAVREGKYSQISPDLKQKIEGYYGKTTANYAFINSYLYPENYYTEYAGFLCPNPETIPDMIHLLTEVGELCSRPDLEKEKLKIAVKTLQL